MPAQWLSSTSEISDRVSSSLESGLRGLSQPSRLRRLRQLVLALLVLWLIYSLARLLWAFVPADEAVLAEGEIINPVSRPQASQAAAPVDLEQMRDWHLFGEAGAVDAVLVPEPEVISAEAREGIEKGAKETRLKLRLRGVVASTAEGLGHAIIEYQSKQAVYAVEDKLPVSGNVILAKVMPRQVVLDNGGTYELLPLYEETELDRQFDASPARSAASRPAGENSARVDKRGDMEATGLAQGYRDRLYQNPQSLAEVVTVNAVRMDGELLGYRISPGKDKKQFRQLGFQAGDIVTSVNGITLDDPANTMRLYQTMRTATEAVFELERNEQAVSLSVSLAELGK